MIRRLALGFGMTALLATSGLHATMFYSEKVTIPFEFRVGKQLYMPGEYRVEQDFGKDIAYLVNVKTGRKAQLLRPLNSQTPGSRTLTFEKSGDVRVLKAIW